jgi:dTDP-4-amino-4,6-dideoxygalactose transaminase
MRTPIASCVRRVLDDGQFVGGKVVAEFEERLADYCAAAYCVGVGNGTDALTIALLALGIGRGDEVIVPAVSFFATAESVVATGAVPRFCDIDNRTATLDPALLPAVAGPRTRAIIPVHLYGRPADMDGIMEFARARSIRVVEDCAQAAGTTYRGRPVGSIGDAGCFSFYPSKNLGALGDAGAIVSNDEAVARRCRMLGNHGELGRYEHQIVGFNSRLDALQAAVLLAKLDELDDWNGQRRELAARYRAVLQHPRIEHLAADGDADHSFHLFVVRVDDRDSLIETLRAAGIGAAVHYPYALPFLPPFENESRTQEDFPHASRHAATCLSVPLFPFMEEKELQRVSDVCLEYLSRS